MNEFSTISFDYSLVDKKTSELLKDKENQLSGIYGRYSSEVGKVLFEAQQQLADYNNDGLFEKWYTSIGFKKRSVYNYINIYSEVQTLHGEQRDIFLEQPKSVQIEMSKPSAIKEANQAVYDGDIKTHKEYKELEKQLKQQAELIESMADSMHDFELHAKGLADENEQLKNRKPEVIEKEVTPEDYEDLKRTKDYLTKRNEHLEKEHQELLSQRKEVNEKSQKYDELTNAIQQSQGELNRVQQQIADYDGLHKVLKEGNALLAKLSVLVYSDLSDAVANDTLVKNELDILLSRFLKLNEDITKKITNNMIIEGEIIND